MSDEASLQSKCFLVCLEPTEVNVQGASPREIIFEACRRNNTSLLSEVCASFKTAEELALLLNTATDGIGSYCLHVAATYGSCMCLADLSS